MYECLAEALFYCGYEFLGNYAAHDGVNEFKVALFERFKAHLNNTELTCAAGLLLMLTFCLCRRADGFTIGYTGLCELCFYLELVLELCAGNVDMCFAYTADEYVARLRILLDADCWVFLGEPSETCDYLIVLTLLLCGNCQ